MPMTEPEPPVLAITAENDLMHIAPAAAMLEHIDGEATEAGPAGDPVPVYEFYDLTGRPLQLVTAASGGQSLEPVPGAPDPTPLGRQLLVDRIDLVMARTQVVLSTDLANGVAADGARVPRVQGDLREVVTALAAVVTFDDDSGPRPGNWVHNMKHRIFG